MIRSYQSDLEKIDKLLKRVENGEALKSISELRKELAESIIQKIRDQFKIKRKLMHEQITEEVEDGEHVFRLMVNSKVMCVVRTMPQAGYLGDITTTQGERRKGYGKNLLTHVEKITKQHKAQTIETTDIDPLDYDTICFFKGVGYEIEKIEDDKRGFVKAVKNL
jgi:GNAT superfamily N-acetyltransferase